MILLIHAVQLVYLLSLLHYLLLYIFSQFITLCVLVSVFSLYQLIAGSDNGSLRLYDVQQWQSAGKGRNFNAYDDFDQLTSVHVNATDELFIVSGYSKNVALYDIN